MHRNFLDNQTGAAKFLQMCGSKELLPLTPILRERQGREFSTRFQHVPFSERETGGCYTNRFLAEVARIAPGCRAGGQPPWYGRVLNEQQIKKGQAEKQSSDRVCVFPSDNLSGKAGCCAAHSHDSAVTSQSLGTLSIP